MRICFIPWGDPKYWRFAKYHYEDTSTEGFSTLNLLFSSNKLAPDAVVLYVLDTLASSFLSKSDIQKLSKYVDLVKEVESYIRKYLCVKDKTDKIHIVVFPGVMGRGSKSIFQFEAELKVTRLLMLYSAYSKILEILGSNSKGNFNDLEVILDTTHGLNYFTILVRETVFEAVATASVALAKTVLIRVFNADPFPVGQPQLQRSENDPCNPVGEAEIPVLRYNLLNENLVEPWSLVGYLKYDVNNVNKILSDPRRCGFNANDLKKDLEFARKIVASFRVGAVAELIDLVLSNPKWSDEIMDLINKTYRCWEESACINEESKGLDVSIVKPHFGAKIMEGLRLLIHAHAIFSGVRSSLISRDDLKDKEISPSESIISLKTINEITKKFLNGSKVISTLIESEIGAIESMREKRLISNKWKLYAEVYGSGPELECSMREAEKESIDERRLKRNFIAHAGFLKDFIELRENKEDVVIKFRDKCKETIDHILNGIFKDDLTIKST